MSMPFLPKICIFSTLTIATFSNRPGKSRSESISRQRSLSLPPGNIRKTAFFGFQGVKKGKHCPEMRKNSNNETSLLTFTCSKSTTETPEKEMKHVRS